MDSYAIAAIALAGIGMGILVGYLIGYSLGHNDGMTAERDDHKQHIKMILNSTYGRHGVLYDQDEEHD